MTRVVKNVKTATLEPIIRDKIKKGTIVSSDELKSYNFLASKGYKHGSVNHSADQWFDGVHHVNSLEGFWSRLKNSIRGTHIHVSAKHLPKYLGEFEFRYNMRKAPEIMFPRLLLSF